MAVTEITIGKSGSGKSYYVVYQIVRFWLPFSHNQKLHTNLPLNIDAIAEYFIEEDPKIVSTWVTDRISLIPKSETDLWQHEKSGPWDYFREKDLSGCRLVIDEIHNFVHLKSKQEYIHRWRQWLGELRHQGCEFEAISQYETKIHPLIRHECGLKRVLESFDDKRDPIFWVKFYDHFQIVSKIKGYWSSRVWYCEYKPSATSGNMWEKSGGGTIPLIPKYYACYNSYSAPISGNGTSSKRQPHPFQALSWAELLKWYGSRNIVNIILSICAYSFALYLFAFGGIISFFLSAFTSPKTAQSAAPGHGATEKKESDHVSPLPKPAFTSPRGVFDSSGKPWVPTDTRSVLRSAP